MGYYYDDPLEAAWMAKHFEMRFNFTEMRNAYPGFKEKRQRSNVRSWKVITEQGKHSDRFYLTVSSLHLLEPIACDLCEYQDDFPGSYTYEVIDPICESDAPPYFTRIIMRNGIPFMWPKQEA